MEFSRKMIFKLLHSREEAPPQAWWGYMGKGALDSDVFVGCFLFFCLFVFGLESFSLESRDVETSILKLHHLTNT